MTIKEALKILGISENNKNKKLRTEFIEKIGKKQWEELSRIGYISHGNYGNRLSQEELLARSEYVLNSFEEPIKEKLSFRLENGQVKIGLEQENGTWVYADDKQISPFGIYFLTFNKYGTVLKELEEMINYPNIKERDLQKFFEKHPELLKGDEYDLIIPQATIIGNNTNWEADFVLRPFDQSNFCKILELKIPQFNIIKKERSGHINFYSELNTAIQQLKDYYKAFHNENTKKIFAEKYKTNVFEPDLQLLIGRKWDIKYNSNMLSLQRDSNIKINDWDTLTEQLKRKFT